ncbi:hypothetical protein D9619_011034 [Psilocybe cf. subviscida]|uniref:Mis12 domain-containing protein n=1 Tax=Psilocybe cf. subviscida TaxID=2480587 RepID=A0A8H5B939_9AGAR|nr:hypothetical protein D9619_011034 [Psilocybe cf. subviscida]
MASSSSNAPSVSARTPNVPPLLLCEALGFSPQLLLDDIINIANNAVQDGVNGMEEFLNKWADERMALEDANPKAGSRTTSTLNADADATIHEVEQGLVAFQTLLEYHTDIAFDFFEAWCLRNIFMIPPDLPVVLPHQAGLDLTATPEKEQALMDEVEELRKQLDAQRKLKRVLQRAVRTSARQRQHAETRLTSLSSINPTSQTPAQDPLHTLPPKILAMYTTLASLSAHAPLNTIDVPARAPSAQADPGKRQWETSRTGYLSWAVGRLVERAEGTADASGANMDEMGAGVTGGAGKAAVDAAEAGTADVGTSAELQRALAAVEAVGAVRRDLEGVRSPVASQGASQGSSQSQSQGSSQGQSTARRQSQGSSSQSAAQPQRRQSQAGQRRQSLIPSQNRNRRGEVDKGKDVDADGDVPMDE